MAMSSTVRDEEIATFVTNKDSMILPNGTMEILVLATGTTAVMAGQKTFVMLAVAKHVAAVDAGAQNAKTKTNAVAEATAIEMRGARRVSGFLPVALTTVASIQFLTAVVQATRHLWYTPHWQPFI